ncbi:Protein kinase, catalytic domain-containing protein [Cynara cardunculus var. scolymus]|uniref:Protein kinase, catalytic domain-containing protein n=1 Tax=Cynara cardunculus var. scolymus TaxID=59895 RepID=A0A103XTD3_CYNCS|nr:Protein kinase, catalytic domain-containing protein [Cynara cardunculus var. scolymus]
MTLEAVDHNHNHQGVETKNVLVGIRFDECGRELLDWAIVKVADAGDRVIAINVCRNSDSVSKYKTLLDDYLADYEGLCDHKQVDITGQVLRGNSVRKVLVREAKFYSAAAVIVGVSKIKAFGGWLSIAKYCAKKLPLATEVLALHNGKVVFKRFSNGQLSGSMRDPRPSFYLIGNSHLKDTRSEFCESEASDMGRHSSEGVQSFKDEDLSPFEMRKKALSSVSVVLEDFAHQRPGWPLLRANSALTPSAMEARKMSVVKWVMNLPNRSSPGTPTTPSSSSEISPKSSGSDYRSEYSIFTNTSNESNTPKSHELPEILNLLLKTNPSRCQWIGFDLLRASTSHFATENLIGKGGCHRVYKGVLPDGKMVAVKIRKSSREAWKDYILEIDIMTSLDHKNITPLLGICVEDDNLISVYDLFFAVYFLYSGLTKDKSVLSWEVRLNVATGVAEALNYLHKECPRPVIHRDIKSSNILLSDEFEPQAKPKLEKGDLASIMDVDLDKEVDKDEIVRMGLAAMLCLTRSARKRPTMAQVLRILRGEHDLATENGLDDNKEEDEDDDDDDDEVYPESNAESHMSLAFLDVEEKLTSFGSVDINQHARLSLEGYLRGRWSRTSSLD